MTQDKNILRQEARKALAVFDKREESPESAAQHFFNSIKLQEDQVIAGYWPNGYEFDCSPILERCLQEGYQCALPKVQKDSRVLNFVRWDESVALQKGPYNILEPESDELIVPDIVIVPMLAFDRRGYRLGQGGGYYDATLSYLRAKKDILAIGVAYAQQACLFNLPVEAHDQKLDWIVTPQAAQKTFKH